MVLYSVTVLIPGVKVLRRNDEQSAEACGSFNVALTALRQLSALQAVAFAEPQRPMKPIRIFELRILIEFSVSCRIGVRCLWVDQPETRGTIAIFILKLLIKLELSTRRTMFEASRYTCLCQNIVCAVRSAVHNTTCQRLRSISKRAQIGMLESSAKSLIGFW